MLGVVRNTAHHEETNASAIQSRSTANLPVLRSDAERRAHEIDQVLRLFGWNDRNPLPSDRSSWVDTGTRHRVRCWRFRGFNDVDFRQRLDRMGPAVPFLTSRFMASPRHPCHSLWGRIARLGSDQISPWRPASLLLASFLAAVIITVATAVWGWHSFVQARPALHSVRWSHVDGYFRAPGSSIWAWNRWHGSAWSAFQATDLQNLFPPGVARGSDEAEATYRATGRAAIVPAEWGDALIAMGAPGGHAEAVPSPRYAQFDMLAVGWPFRAFRCTTLEYRPTPHVVGERTVEGLDLDADDARPWWAMVLRGAGGAAPGGVGASVAPTSVRLGPLAANVAVYAAALLAIGSSPRWFRRWRDRRRRKHGRCGRCGYDLRGRPDHAPPCSECGAATTPGPRPPRPPANHPA
jgi:hypothetical protein